ncbi:pyridoxal-phosphate dependent enzyme [Colwellia sp. BRX10-3]|uniref:1-aminocyclopropane-1-carboxylate deaminase/D-cysteine desulfhydrase n=1 Tax=Colwellia sp. BRX10-3 TaxID=2759844 RepID=UPI0015F675BC|nr:pyridoxal-phosphate dependent enzyme [Colwellia sp. BRX10-3]MBA6389757.1 pyridoxal-phosphate dependent enzyme [Colwellia sp. BRX10-3]
MPPLSVLQPITHPIFTQHKLTVQVKRDDQIDGIISGNKWRKLKYNLLHAKSIGAKGVITFGGCFSNHIHACAFACQQQQLPVIGIIRGEDNHQDNYTLAWAKNWGMQLSFVDRKSYRLRHDEHYLQQLQQQYPDHLIIPEGGSNSLALTGVAEVINELNQQSEFDTLITPVGSGGTLAGLIVGDKSQHNLLGIAVLKQQDYLENEVKALLPSRSKNAHNWRIAHEFHRGGYAKFSPQDAEKIRNFSDIVGIGFEPVYSGKMILALLELIESGYFPAHHRIVLLHTGGLQGLAGMFERGLLNQDEWPSLPVPPVQ